MPTYILLSKLTAEGRKTVRERPNRIQEVDREMLEALQVKVISQHAVVGPYDFVNIVEAPDNETILKASVELGSRGTVEIMSMPAIPIDEFIQAIKSDKQLQAILLPHRKLLLRARSESIRQRYVVKRNNRGAPRVGITAVG